MAGGVCDLGGWSKELPFVRRRAGEPRFPAPAATATLSDGRCVPLESVPCLLCGDGSAEPILVVKDWRHGLTRDPFLIVRCRGCGLAWLNPRPVYESMGDLYPAAYYSQRRLARPAAGNGPPGGPGAGRISAKGLAEQAALCGPLPAEAGRALDVGCATGSFLFRMRSQGWDVQGVEVSRDAADWGTKELDLDIVNKPLTEAGLPAGRFDVVTFWSSLEHVHNPLDYLVEAHRVLKPGGRTIILMQNFASPTVKWLRWGLDPPRHLYHFTPRTLTRLLAKAGFDPRAQVRSRTRILDGSFDRQVAKIGRRLMRASGNVSNGHGGNGNGPGRHPSSVLGTGAGWALARGARLLAPLSWTLTALGLNGAMVVTARKP